MMRCEVRENTMVDLLARQASQHGDATAYLFLGEGGEEAEISFAELDQRARAVAATLQARLSPGDRALLVYPAGLDFITAFFGCLYAGVVAVPATYPKPRRPLPRMNRIAADCGARVALTTSQTLATVDRAQIETEVGRFEWIATDSIETDALDHWCHPDLTEENLAFLQYTSGSTSDPKGVMVSHGNLLSNLEAISQAFGIGQVEADHVSSTGVFWLPAYHDMGLIGGILTPLYVGGRSVLMAPTAFLQRPIRWLQAIDDYQATISGAPNFAYELCVKRTTPDERAGLNLQYWRLAFCGAEPIRAETIRRFAESFFASGFRAESLYPCYGLAESTLLAAGPHFADKPTIASFHRAALADHRVVPAAAEPPEHIQELVGCGTALPEHEVVVAEPETLVPCPPDRVGEILLRGPSVAQGYWNRPEETEAVFGSRVAGRQERFLRTGDLGFVRDGHLYVTGRLKDVIIVRGRNHYPQDIEQTAEESHAAVLPGAAFAMSVDGREQLVVVHQVDRQFRSGDWTKVVAAIRRSIVANHELDPHAIVLIRQTSLPVTSSGKVQRSLCRQQYLDGTLKVVHQWTSPAPARHHRNGVSRNNGKHSTAEGRLDVRVDRSGITWSQNGNGHRSHSDRVVSPRDSRPASAVDRQFHGMNVDRAAERIEAWMLQWLVERVGLDPSDVQQNKPFAEFGVDSLTAVELSQELEDEFGVELTPIVAWNHPTPAALSRYLAEQATGTQPATEVETAATPSDADADIEVLLSAVENLSDEEAARLLDEE